MRAFCTLFLLVLVLLQSKTSVGVGVGLSSTEFSDAEDFADPVPEPEESGGGDEESSDADYVDVNSKKRKSEILDTILEGDYDAKVRPPGLDHGKGPVNVKISLFIRSIENIDDIKMEYTVQLTYRQEWVDPRLRYSHIIRHSLQYLQLTEPDRIWMPDIFFSNEKIGALHQLMIPNLFTRIYPDGRVLQSYRITLLLNCPMSLHTYPLDVQICPIRMASYGWTTNDLTLQWREWMAVEMAGDFQMARFELKNHYTEDECLSVTTAGNFSCVKVHFTFDRQFGFYLIQIYIPSALLVVISWVSFWLEPTAAEARVSLGVTTILAIVTETHGINESVPPASYIKALDVWMAVCQAMVFAALIQFSYVNYIAHFQWKQIDRHYMLDYEDNPRMKEHRLEQLREMAMKKAKRIDLLSQLLFPLSFLLFNIAYWTGYLLADNTNRSYANH